MIWIAVELPEQPVLTYQTRTGQKRYQVRHTSPGFGGMWHSLLEDRIRTIGPPFQSGIRDARLRILGVRQCRSRGAQVSSVNLPSIYNGTWKPPAVQRTE